MIDKRLFYQFGFFAIHNVRPEPDSISYLVRALKPWNLVPTTVNAFQVNPAVGLTGANVAELQMNSPGGELSVQFEPNRYVIQMNVQPVRDEVPIERFAEVARQIMTVLNLQNTHRASRLSYVTRLLCTPMDQKELADIHSRLFHVPLPADVVPGTEWSTRQVGRGEAMIADRPEVINFVLDVNRIQGFLGTPPGILPFDRIELGFDINTFQGNVETRFDTDTVQPFIHFAHGMEKASVESLEGVFYGN